MMADGPALNLILGPEGRRYFLRELRAARAQTLRDAEGFPQIIHCIERLGSFLSGGTTRGLWRTRAYLTNLAEQSPLACEIPEQCPFWHTKFHVMLDRLRRARNEAAHEGVYARHLTRSAVEVSIVLEDALAVKMTQISDLMVRNAVCAEMWEPVSFVRQKMITDSFSFVPVHTGRTGHGWEFVSDRRLAAYLSKGRRTSRLAQSLSSAVGDGLELEPAECFGPSLGIEEVLGPVSERPVLIVDDEDTSRLLGILTAFDLL